MDYIEELKKIREELLEIEVTYPKARLYKILAYKNVLDDFVKKEYDNFYSEILKDIPELEEKELKPLKLDNGLMLRARFNLNSLSKKDKMKAIYLSRKMKDKTDNKMDKIKELFAHANTNETMKLYSKIALETTEEN